ncbi:hypothetical protein [Corynebacterium variabile]|uniref:hypothetical protein n=1 Tax=Corynebacterium variabile TaxID=1727 RepID=UPI003BB05073
MSTSDSTSAPRSPRRWWLVVPVVLAVIVALVAWNSTRGSDNTTNSAPSDAPTQGPVSPSPEQEGTPGASIDSTQRNWPDPTGLFDDTQYEQPGQYSVDLSYNRPVLTPVNHDGDLPDAADLDEGMSQCSAEEIKLPGKTTQQYVNARFLVVDEKSGPTTMKNDVPGGYAHTPAGGITAALNQMGYGMYGVGDEVGNAIDEKLWSTSDWVQTVKSDYGDTTGKPSAQAMSRSQQIAAPWGYKVVTCAADIMVVDVLTKAPDGISEDRTEGNYAVKVTLRWSNGDWVPDFTGTGDADIEHARDVSSEETEAYTAVDFS